MPPRRFLKLGGSLSQARYGFAEAIPPLVPPVVFPQPGVSADLDFVRRRYFWNGATRTEADFTTLTLNGATFGAQGLDFSTCSVNPSVTIALASLGITQPPCVYALAGYWPSAPSATKTIVQFDDGTDNERFVFNITNVPATALQTLDGGVSQSNQNVGITPGAARWGVSYSAQLNDIKASGNGTAAPPDTVATMPTVTTLRLGCRIAVGTFAPAIISRLWLYSAIKTQAELDLLSTQVRDAP
jgi:hypothetical protein